MISFGIIASAVVTGGAFPYSLVVSATSAPYVNAFPFSDTSGFGARYTNPGTLPAGTVLGVAMSPAGDQVFMGQATTPFVAGYPFSGGFGTKYADPATLYTVSCRGVDVRAGGTHLAAAGFGALAGIVWAISGSGFGAKVSDPGVAIDSNMYDVSFAPNGNSVSFAGNTTINGYTWSSGFGTKAAAAVGAAGYRGVTFSRDNAYILAARSSSPNIDAWPWSGSAFGTKIANPATLPTAIGLSVCFNPAGTYVAVGTANTTPFVAVYPWSGGFGAKVADPSTLPGNAVNGISFSPSGDSLLMAASGAPFLHSYAWSGGFGAKAADPSGWLGGNANDLAIT